MTLIELLLALAGTAMIGAAIATMLAAVGYGTDSNHDLRELVAKRRIISARLNAQMRQARQVLAVGEDHAVLWMRDLDEDDQPSTLEIVRIHFDSNANAIGLAKAGDGAEDLECEFDGDFSSITSTLIDDGVFAMTQWSDGIADVVMSHHADNVQDAVTVTARLTLVAGPNRDTLLCTAGRRR